MLATLRGIAVRSAHKRISRQRVAIQRAARIMRAMPPSDLAMATIKRNGRHARRSTGRRVAPKLLASVSSASTTAARGAKVRSAECADLATLRKLAVQRRAYAALVADRDSAKLALVNASSLAGNKRAKRSARKNARQSLNRLQRELAVADRALATATATLPRRVTA